MMKFMQWLAVSMFVHMSMVQAATIDPAKTVVTATFKQLGVEVTAKFNQVNGVIDFNPADPMKAKAQMAVALASFDMGEPEYNKEAQKKEWFNSAQFPQAQFVSSAIQPLSAGKLLVQGKLTVKGKTLDLSVPLSFRREWNAQIFEGQLPIKRLYFNVGEGEWKDTDTLADEIVIKFKVVTAN